MTSTFSHALAALKTGRAVQRKSWHGSAFVSISPGNPQLPAANVWSPANRALAMALPNQTVAVSASFSLAHPGHGIIHMGWLPSADDLLAEDWLVLE